MATSVGVEIGATSVRAVRLQTETRSGLCRLLASTEAASGVARLREPNPVLALVQRKGAVRTQVVESVNAKTLKVAIRESVAPSADVMTDEWPGYWGLRKEDKSHKMVRHNRGEYARRGAHVNTAESFFALLKRACTERSTTSRNATFTAMRTSLAFDGRSKMKA